MVIQLAFAYAPKLNGDGTSGKDFHITQFAESSVSGVQHGCEAAAAFIAARVVDAAKKALADARATLGEGEPK